MNPSTLHRKTDATSGSASTRRAALAVLVAGAALGLGACAATDTATEAVQPVEATSATDTASQEVSSNQSDSAVNDTAIAATSTDTDASNDVNNDVAVTTSANVPAAGGTSSSTGEAAVTDGASNPTSDDQIVTADANGQPPAPPTDTNGQPPAPPIDTNGQSSTPPTDTNGQPPAPPTDANGQPAGPPTGQAGRGGPGGGFSTTSAASAADLNSMLNEAVGDGGLGLHRGHQPIEATLTSVLGISHEELHVRMEQQGQNLAAVATDVGIDPQTLIDALVAAWSPAIDSVESSGAITADQATQYRQSLVDAFTFRVNWNGSDTSPTFNIA